MKFKENDQVKITKGYYKGFHGKVISEVYQESSQSGTLNKNYEVYIPLLKITITIPGEKLEKEKPPYTKNQ